MKKATIFVHPGFLRRLDSLIPASTVMGKNPYGPYEIYLRNLEKFYRGKSGPLILFLGVVDEYIHKCHNGFNPRDIDLVLDFSKDVDKFVVYQGESDRWIEEFKIDRDNLAIFLQSRGMFDFEIVGEMGPYKYSYQGCVGEVYSLIAPHSNIVGVPGCVYPTTPYTNWINPLFIKELEEDMGGKDKFYEERLGMFRGIYPNKEF